MVPGLVTCVLLAHNPMCNPWGEEGSILGMTLSCLDRSVSRSTANVLSCVTNSSVPRVSPTCAEDLTCSCKSHPPLVLLLTCVVLICTLSPPSNRAYEKLSEDSLQQAFFQLGLLCYCELLICHKSTRKGKII